MSRDVDAQTYRDEHSRLISESSCSTILVRGQKRLTAAPNGKLTRRKHHICVERHHRRTMVFSDHQKASGNRRRFAIMHIRSGFGQIRAEIAAIGWQYAVRWIAKRWPQRIRPFVRQQRVLMARYIVLYSQRLLKWRLEAQKRRRGSLQDSAHRWTPVSRALAPAGRHWFRIGHLHDNYQEPHCSILIFCICLLDILITSLPL